jgi:hypothetical protein
MALVNIFSDMKALFISFFVTAEKPRRWFAERLRRFADRMGPEDAFAATSSRFYFVARVGLVVKTDDGIRISPEPRGVRLWYRRSDYDRAFTPNGDYFTREDHRNDV